MYESESSKKIRLNLVFFAFVSPHVKNIKILSYVIKNTASIFQKRRCIGFLRIYDKNGFDAAASGFSQGILLLFCKIKVRETLMGHNKGESKKLTKNNRNI